MQSGVGVCGFEVVYMGSGLRWLRLQGGGVITWAISTLVEIAGGGLHGVGVRGFEVAYMGLGLHGLRIQGWRLHWVKKHGFGVHRNDKTLCWDISGEGILLSSSS